MCGRARCSLRADDIPRACRRNDGSVRMVHMDRYRPSFNVAPGSNVPVVRREDGSGSGGSDGVVLHCMKWGLIPSFTKKSEKPDHFKMFNARSESIGEKASFRRLIPKNRCLVAVEGFYEWKKDGSKRQPYYIHFKDGRPLVLAALYDSWENPEGEILYTFTILTTSSSSALEWLHDRMPVIFGDKEASDEWLNCSSSKVDALLKPHEDSDLVWYPVTPAMGKPSFDGPECIKEIKLKSDGNIPISKFFLAKGTKKEALKPDDQCAKADPSERVKEEPELKPNTELSSSPEIGEDESKPIVSSLPQESAEKCQKKRDHEDLSTASKFVADDTKKLCASPGTKKVKLKSAGDHKQPTMFAYFGKK